MINRRPQKLMITSRKQLRQYLLADKVALERLKPRPSLNDFIWKYEILLRYSEYYGYKAKSGGGVLFKFISKLYRLKKDRLGTKLGFTIPENVFDMGLSIAHVGTIVVSGGAKVGKNCRIHVDVNIGTELGQEGAAPMIGDNVFISPGVKIFGKINIADGIVIGANAVVNKSFNERNISIAGVPARKIGENGRESYEQEKRIIEAVSKTMNYESGGRL